MISSRRIQNWCCMMLYPPAIPTANRKGHNNIKKKQQGFKQKMLCIHQTNQLLRPIFQRIPFTIDVLPVRLPPGSMARRAPTAHLHRGGSFGPNPAIEVTPKHQAKKRKKKKKRRTKLDITTLKTLKNQTKTIKLYKTVFWVWNGVIFFPHLGTLCAQHRVRSCRTTLAQVSQFVTALSATEPLVSGADGTEQTAWPQLLGASSGAKPQRS